MTSWIEAEELADIIKSKERNADYLVIDVRDDDYVGGHITGSVNKPSQELDVAELVESYSHVPLIVFHCAMSQVRRLTIIVDHGSGDLKLRTHITSFTQSYEKIRKLQAKADDPQQRVVTLRGGFSDFQRLYKDNPRLVVDWEAKHWC